MAEAKAEQDNAIGAARNAHHFLSVTKQGMSAIVETTGNRQCHAIVVAHETETQTVILLHLAGDAEPVDLSDNLKGANRRQ